MEVRADWEGRQSRMIAMLTLANQSADRIFPVTDGMPQERTREHAGVPDTYDTADDMEVAVM
jgi:hypothetical protein